MKVCICSFTGYEMLSGANLKTYFLAKEFLRRGFDLSFVVPSKEDVISCEKRFDVKAKDVGLSIKRFDESRLKRYPRFALKAKKYLKNFDLIFGQSLPSALAVRLAKTKAKKVVEYVDLWSEYWIYANPTLKGKLIYKFIKGAEKFSLKKNNLIFTITNELKRMLVKRKANPDKIKIIRDGVDLKMFKPLKVKNTFLDKYKLSRKEDYVVYQGGIAAHDGVQFLVDAAPLVLKENPDVKFLIVGTGSYLNEIKRQVSKLNLNKNFIFTGWVNYSEMPSFMNLAKINSVPLPDSPATRGVVTYKLMEAIACGTPTIIGDLPGVREAVRHKENAYLAKSEDKISLSKGINELLNNKGLYNQIKKNGFKMIKNHDWRLIAKDMVDMML